MMMINRRGHLLKGLSLHLDFNLIAPRMDFSYSRMPQYATHQHNMFPIEALA